MSYLVVRFARLVIGALIVCASFAFSTAQAATVTDITDQITTLVVSTQANHKFIMTVASAADEGETITVTFTSAFTTNAITEDDVDIADDGTDLTTAANCSGTEKASVVMAAGVLTMTICVGDGGAIAAGSVVTIEIGTNAAASGTGTGRIMNPSATGTYFVAIGGTFGDTGSVPLAMVSDDNNGVSATLPGSSSSGGGGGGGGGASGGASSSGDGDGGDDSDDADTAEDTTDTESEDTSESTEDSTTDDASADATTDTSSESTSDGGTSSDADGGGGSTSGDSGGASSSGGGSNGGGASTLDSNGGGGSSDVDDSDESDGGAGDDESDGGDDTADDGGGSAGANIGIGADLIAPGGVTLTPEDATFPALAGTSPTLRVDIDGNTDDVTSVEAIIDGVGYTLSDEGDGTYTGTISVPSVDSALVVEVTTDSGAVTRETYYLDVRGAGVVYEVIDEVETPVNGATVTVYSLIGGSRVAWDASLYGEENPVVVGADGTFAWYVPNGTYVVSAGKSGYEDAAQTVTVRNHVLSARIRMTREDTPTMTPVSDSDVEQTPSSPTNAVEFVAATVATLTEVLNEVRAIPEVHVASSIAVPTAAVMATTSVVVLASSFNLLPYLQYIFTAPLLLFGRRKRKAYGIVYNAASKLPVDLAIVRVFAMPEKRLVRSVVTDQQGKYLVSLAPGTYALEVMKPNFTYPSAIVRGATDGTYLDVYTGQIIEVTDNDATVAANIPLDPVGQAAALTPRAVATTRFLRALQQVLSVVGIVLAAAVLVIVPSVFSAIMFVVQILVYALVRRLAHAKKPKGWGIVYDTTTKRPVGNTIVRLFEPQYNKLIETVLTDRLGRYAFLVGPNEYYVTFSKPGYDEKIVRPVDFRSAKEPSAVSLEVGLDAAKGV